MIHLIAGVPGSGKSYICAKIAQSCPKVMHIPHDSYPTSHYSYILNNTKGDILAECPFRVSVLEAELKVPFTTYYLVEPLDLTIKRYEDRMQKDFLKMHETNWYKYAQRSPKYNQQELIELLIKKLS